MAFLSLNVSAAEVVSLCDFSMEEGEVEKDGWLDDGSEAASSVRVGDDPIDPENKVLVMTHDPLLTSGGGAIALRSFTSPVSGELVCAFDIMFAKEQSNIQILVGVNGMRYSCGYRTESFGLPNVWYSVIIHIEEGNQYGNLYKKIKGSNEDYVSLTVDHATATHSLQGVSFYTTKGKVSTEGDPDIVYIDNFRAFSGLYMEDIKFVLGETQIKSVAEIIKGGILIASYNLMNADLSEESTTLVSEFDTMFPAMVIFDKKGKMLDCVSFESDMALFENPVELTADITPYADKLDGGSVRLYVIDSLKGHQVLIDEVVLPTN